MDHHSRVRGKVLTRDELIQKRAQAQRDGRAVVQCHGCFDIVHPGHIRHLQHAASQGDILLVSLTADSLVGKGTGRPLFNQDLRAENLAALDFVDWVHVNEAPTAEELLSAVRPDVYVKGREYEHNRDPRFKAEREAVERAGGRVIFSSGDVVFSSTALIRALERGEVESGLWQGRLNEVIESRGLSPERLMPMIGNFAGRRVCVVGEVIIDTYVQCDRPDVAGESPVLSLRPLSRRSFDGAAAIIARHLAALGAKPTLVTALPRSAQAEALRTRLAAEGVEVRSIEIDQPLLEKQRFLVGAQKVMKLDLVQPIALDEHQRDSLLGMVRECGIECEGAIVADFGNGLLTSKVLHEVFTALRRRVRILTGDVSGRRAGLLRMGDADLLCPTELELRDAVRDYDDSLNAVVWRLMESTAARNVLVTMGADGLIAFERLNLQNESNADRHAWRTRLSGAHVPAMTTHAVDPLGCGDTLIAVATLAMIAGGSAVDGAFLGSLAAGSQAMRLGNEPIGAAELRKGLHRVFEARLAVETTSARMVS